MRTRLAVGAIVFREDDAVLLVRRGRPPLEGAWSLPGGKVEPGESLAAAVVREVLEETGLQVAPEGEIATVCLPGPDELYEIHEHRCSLRPGVRPEEARAGDDARDVLWCRQDALDGLGLTADVLRVIGLARASLPGHR
jgi:8-oxo-dGTP diphosphatase